MRDEIVLDGLMENVLYEVLYSTKKSSAVVTLADVKLVYIRRTLFGAI